MAKRRRAQINVDGGLAEHAWQATVVGAAELYGWRHYHTHDSRRSVGGFPDLVLVRRGERGPAAELLFVELKTDRGKTTAEQDAWLEDLGAVEAGVELMLHALAAKSVVPVVAVEAHVWRPRDWPDVERRLAAGRHRLPPVSGPMAGRT